MDTLVFDIETKNTFADVGGDAFLKNLDMSVVGIYSYNKKAYFCFDEHQIKEMGELFQSAGLIVGFCINRFDVPVLEKYFPFKLSAIPRLDILEEIEYALGHRIKLDTLARTNLGGQGKSGDGLDAPRLYREGKIEELKAYCLQDVKITKELYDLGRKQKHLLVPKRYSNELVKAEFNWVEQTLPSTLF